MTSGLLGRQQRKENNRMQFNHPVILSFNLRKYVVLKNIEILPRTAATDEEGGGVPS